MSGTVSAAVVLSASRSVIPKVMSVVLMIIRSGKKPVTETDGPNCAARQVFLNGEWQIFIIAIKDIPPGDILYWDYGYGYCQDEFTNLPQTPRGPSSPSHIQSEQNFLTKWFGAAANKKK